MNERLLTVYYLLGLWATRPLRRSRRGLRLLRRVYERGFRQNLRRSAHYRPYADTPLGDMLATDKVQHLADFDQLNTVGVTLAEATALAERAEQTRDFRPMIGEVSVGLSSGTSGTRGIFLANRRERARWTAAIVDRVLGFSLRHRRVAFFLRANNGLYEAVDSRLVSFDFYDLARPLSVLAAEAWASGPDILVAQPSVLLHLARGVEVARPPVLPSRVISVAEVLEDDVAAYVGRVFGCRVEQVYQATEGFLAHTCREGRLHLNDDFLVVERRAAGPGRFHPVVTDLWRRSQPLVRYELNDILHVDEQACPCGLASTVIARIEGRADDVFVFRGTGSGTGAGTRGEGALEVTVFPDFVRRAVALSSEHLRNYEVARTGRRRVGLYVDAAPGHEAAAYDAAAQALDALFRRHGLEDIEIVRSTTVYNAPTAKFKRIRNDYGEA